MNLAVVGSRSGAHLDDVQEFILALHRKHPETVIISGGADGVDTVAEQGWLRLGGRVVSFRPKQTGPETYVIERWMLGGLTEGPEHGVVAENSSDGGRAQKPSQGHSRTPVLFSTGPSVSPSGRIDVLDVPTWANYGSAAIYRDVLIAETADRVVAFQRKGGSRGAGFTAAVAKDKEIPVSLYFPDKRFAA